MLATPSANEASWFLATARQRIEGLCDPKSFVEFLPPQERVQSPHLSLFDLPAAFDDGVIVGRAKLESRDVLIAAQEGQFMGGTFAEVSGAKIVGLLRAAARDQALPRAILLLLDSGGVRLQEANAGELAVAEVMRAIAQARTAGAAVVALVGGRSGAFGGAGLTAATCARIVMSEAGRIGVTGPEVIETNKGVEEFDSADKALVWSVVGGKSRRLIGGADVFVEDSMTAFRQAAASALDACAPFSVETLQAEGRRLKDRLAKLGACETSVDMWAALHIPEPGTVRDMTDEAFKTLAARYSEARDGAR